MHITELSTKKQRVVSVGNLLISLLKKPKFYRTSLRGLNHYLLLVKTRIFIKRPRIYLFRIKRFTIRQLKLYRRFMRAIKPTVHYVSCFRSYNKYTLYRRRLKRYV